MNKLKKLKKLVKSDPNNWEVNSLIGEILFRDKCLPRKAIPYLRRALKINSKDDFACIWLGKCYCDLKSYRQALYYGKKAMRISKDHWESLAMIYSEIAFEYLKRGKRRFIDYLLS